MSLFRKPTKKVQRRVFTADDDDEEDTSKMETVAAPVAPPPPQISTMKEKTKSKPILSFVDEEEDDGEVFRVKKSSQSKRLAKLRQKDTAKERSKINGEHKPNSREIQTVDTEDYSQESEVRPFSSKPKKKSLEGLILSGRAALVAEADGDVSDSEGEKSADSTDERGFHKFRADNVRAALDKGDIPDAALIHAARKSRQKARETGKSGPNTDYIPLRSNDASKSEELVPRTGSSRNSRLVREDGSGDEDEDSERVLVRGLISEDSKKPARTMAVDSEGEEWEAQQMSKAKPVFLHPAISMGDYADTEMNPFALAMPLPAAPPAPILPIHAKPFEVRPSNATELVHSLIQRLKVLQENRVESAGKVQALHSQMEAMALKREDLIKKTPLLDKAYRRAQTIRGYITDLTECLDEKMPALEALESRALALHKKRCEYVVERRRADVRDQAQDILALAARPGTNTQRIDDDPTRTRRVAEREGRRRARRLAREAQPQKNHRDGDSSDDELPPAVRHSFATERDELSRECEVLFSDAARAYGSVRGVCRRLSAFRRYQPDSYNDSYCSHSLPKLVAPFVRAQLIMWNPLADENNEDLEKMDWYKSLMMYGVREYEKQNGVDVSSSEDSYSSGDEANGNSTPKVDESSIRDDPDLLLVPTILEKVLIPKITELISVSWDPMSVRSCLRLRGVCTRISSVVRPECFRPLATALLQVLKSSAQHDYFLPVVPAQIYEGKGGALWRRFLGAAVRLLRAILAFTESPFSPVANQVAQTLIQSIVLSSMACGSTAAADAASSVWYTIPTRSDLAKTVAPKVKQLAEKALKDMEGNPLHLKSIEVARSVINQADNVHS